MPDSRGGATEVVSAAASRVGCFRFVTVILEAMQWRCAGHTPGGCRGGGGRKC
jgi:hypothetical protein